MFYCLGSETYEGGERRHKRIKIHRVEGKKRIIYYRDECHDEFSRVRITPKVVDGSFAYFHGGIWNFCSFLSQNVFSMPVKLLYAKMKFRIRYIGREKLKLSKNKGYFIYANHTQPFGDTLIPSLANYPKRNYFIVSPENVSMPGLGSIVRLLGAIPIPCDFQGMKHFLKSIEQIIQKNHSITIYPEAHIWPYDTHIRPFGAVSFRWFGAAETAILFTASNLKADFLKRCGLS